MRLLLASLVALTLVLSAGPQANGSGSSLQQALPAGAKITSAVSLPREPGDSAVTFSHHGWYLGVIAQTSTTSRLIWHRKLPSRPESVSAPGQNGLFRLIVPEVQSPGASILAFVARGSTVTPAIRGAPRGILTAGESVVEKPKGFILLSPDETHVGSVKYRVATLYHWDGRAYAVVSALREPDYAPADYPKPNAIVRTQAGNTILIHLEIAATPQQRETGLMYRPSLDPDSGMVFVWQTRVQESFWMKNTLIPLSIAFLDADGTVLDILDMQPQTTDLHTPAHIYQYAIEVNQGFYAQNNIQVGDRVQLNLSGG